MDGGCYTVHLQRTLAGDLGTMKVLNPYVRSRDIASSFAQTPAAGSNITRRQRSTYASQLRAFTGAILWREDVRTGPDDAAANMSDQGVLRGWATAVRT